MKVQNTEVQVALKALTMKIAPSTRRVQVALRALTMKRAPSTRRLQVVKVEHRGYTWR